jgi:hypothetical protein
MANCGTHTPWADRHGEIKGAVAARTVQSQESTRREGAAGAAAPGAAEPRQYVLHELGLAGCEYGASTRALTLILAS